MKFRRGLLKAASWIGLFRLFDIFARNQLRILCYHGAAVGDLCVFKPKLFISDRTFRRRMHYLSANDWSVLSLSEGIARLKNGTLPKRAVVITIDDGWYGSLEHMVPVLSEYGYPATLYLSTYYVQHQYPVFNIAVQYLLWRSEVPLFDLADVHAELEGSYDLSDEEDKAKALEKVQVFADSLPGAEMRQHLLERMSKALNVDIEQAIAPRSLSFMNATEVSALSRFGVDVQLHTHRHRFPSDSYEAAVKEIEDNRNYLEAMSISNRRHFCYPSGEYTGQQIPWLEQMAIESATTTDLGLNTRRDSVYELKRILDADDLSDVEFEAELCGCLSTLRRLSFGLG